MSNLAGDGEVGVPPVSPGDDAGARRPLHFSRSVNVRSRGGCGRMQESGGWEMRTAATIIVGGDGSGHVGAVMGGCLVAAVEAP